LTLRRDTIVTVLVLLAIAIALPFAIRDTLETHRVYVFSRQFLEELPRRFTGPGRFRFILQPVTALLLGLHGGLPRRAIRPTSLGSSSVAAIEENSCGAAWRPSATCSP